MKSKTDYVREWVRKARSDLKVARREMTAPDPAADAVCFHFQQAVEKLLKAWLIWSEVSFKPTHNIELLLSSCEQTNPSFTQLRAAESLTPYAVEIRYADDFYVPTTAEMNEASAIAQSVENHVIDMFVKSGLDLDEPGTTERPHRA